MTASNGDDRIDRYVRGELTPDEARELAQESLGDPELFDELMCSAAAKKTVAAGLSRGKVIRFRRPGRLIAAGSIAAAIVLASAYRLRLRTPAGIAPATLHATLDPARGAREPVLLAADLPAGGEEQPQIFRGAEAEPPRGPKSAGAIIAFDGGLAVIDAGAADGLTVGSELDVYRGGVAVGHMRVAAVFRERARGPVDGRARARDEVRIPPRAQLTARMDRVRTLAARGDVAGARAAAEEANRWAGSAGLPAEAQVALWNALAVLRLLHQDRGGGEMLLRQALATCPRTDPSYPLLLNNLGVLAESAGDQAGARDRYSSALRALGSDSGEAPAHKRGIESNLSRLGR